MGDVNPNAEILVAINEQTGAIKSMVKGIEGQSTALSKLNQGMTLLLERQGTGRGGGRNGIGLSNVLTLVAGVAAVGAFVLVRMSGDLDKHSESKGHPSLATSVEAIEERLAGEVGRNDRIDGQIVKLQTDATTHNNRVLPLDTEQSMSIVYNCDMIRQLHPDVRSECRRPAVDGMGFR